MERRNALAMAAAATLSLTALGGAIGATTHLFAPADASNLGTVSPVSSTTLPPVIEEHEVDVIDPAPAAAMPATPAGPSERDDARDDVHTSASAPAAAPAPAASPAPAPATSHDDAREHEAEHGADD